MDFAILSSWIKVVLFLLPIWWTGLVSFRRVCQSKKFELVLPASLILGLVIFTFSLNLLAFLFKGPLAVIISFVFVALLSIVLSRFKTNPLDLPKGKSFYFWLITVFVWGVFIAWKANYALIGSDTNLYYAVAHSFIRGNYPLVTPWQPDVPLSYHAGTFELLGAFYYFTGLSLEFLHILFSALFIFLAAQIIIWIWARHKRVTNFFLANLTSAFVFISFGFFKLVLPRLPIKIPQVANLREFVLWARELPTVNQSIEVYGAPINLDALIYFIFHSFGLAIFLLLLLLLIYPRKDKRMSTWIVLSIGLSTLALASESFFVATLPAVIIGVFLVEKREGVLQKNMKNLLVLLFLTALIILFQGGVITNSIFSPPHLESSVVFFPKKEDIREDFVSYHYYQEISKKFPMKDKWLPFSWYHIGVDTLFITALFILFRLRVPFRKKLLLGILFITSLASVFAYNVIVPKFLVANGNRFLATSFLLLAIIISWFFLYFWERLRSRNLLIKLLFVFAVLWLSVPTIIPPLTLLSKTRFGPNKLYPKKPASTEGIKWIRENVSVNTRVITLDVNAPHPSGIAKTLTETGVFSPIFPGNFRAYTIEASPEYVDIAYFLSPKALKKLGISILLMDSYFYENLPEIRKKQLGSEDYFSLLFEKEYQDATWEKVFKIKSKYIGNGGELSGTFEELLGAVPSEGKFYIDNEGNFEPTFIRRPLIFNLRHRNLYFEPGSGVYLNVEVDVPFQHPVEGTVYDYLVLAKKTDPVSICHCRPKLLWKGARGEIYVWNTGHI